MVAYVLQCLARTGGKHPVLEFFVLHNMEALGIKDGNELVRRVQFSSKEELEATVAGLCGVIKDFSLRQERVINLPRYQSPLLSELNAKDTSGLTTSQLCSLDLFRRQLEVERKGSIKFPTVLPVEEGNQEVEVTASKIKEIMSRWRKGLVASLGQKLRPLDFMLKDDVWMQKSMKGKAGYNWGECARGFGPSRRGRGSVSM
jgi:hypothetical protein